MRGIYIFWMVLSSPFIIAQGCSDAGICTIENAVQSVEKEFKNSIAIATVFGLGKANVTYFSPYFSYARKLSNKIAVSSKVTFSSASGSFGTSSAFGDAYLATNYLLKERENSRWKLLIGFKIPFTSSDLKINNNPLPLDYQSSLATFDLFLGGNFNYKKWDFDSVLQVPVFNNNKNTYFKEYSGTDEFPTTNLFERKSDILFRTTYTWVTFNKKMMFRPNILFIYHLGDDRYTTIFGNKEKIIGSEGLTINGNLLTSYAIDKRNSIELSLATPFLIRDIRPDGLTRAYVVSFQYNINF